LFTAATEGQGKVKAPLPIIVTKGEVCGFVELLYSSVISVDSIISVPSQIVSVVCTSAGACT
jgi:hypothetical protein